MVEAYEFGDMKSLKALAKSLRAQQAQDYLRIVERNRQTEVSCHVCGKGFLMPPGWQPIPGATSYYLCSDGCAEFVDRQHERMALEVERLYVGPDQLVELFMFATKDGEGKYNGEALDAVRQKARDSGYGK